MEKFLNERICIVSVYDNVEFVIGVGVIFIKNPKIYIMYHMTL